MAGGLTDREIGLTLAISARTVRMHSEALRKKLGVTQRRHIVPAYVEQQWPGLLTGESRRAS